MPISDPQSSWTQEGIGDIDTSITYQPSHAEYKADVRHVFQQFGEIQRVIMGLTEPVRTSYLRTRKA